MKKKKYSMAQLAANLEKAIHCDVGIRGLRILLYGWMKKTQLASNSLLNERKRKKGEMYLTEREAKSFSKYAGYDLLN